MNGPKLFYIAFLILSLSACSGGGGNGTTNTAPIITSPDTATVEENTTAIVTITATDADGDTLSYSLSGGVDQSAFSIDATTGALSFTTAPDFEAHADANSDNVYEVQVSVSDGIASTTQDISVTVTDANDAPVITNSATPTVVENTITVVTVTATDADGDTLSYSLSGGADQSTFSIDATTGALSFTTAPDFEAHADANSDNVYEVQISVSDGSTSTPQDITVTITDLVIAINAELGTHQPLDGTWSWCNNNDPENDSLNRHFFTDNDFVMESYVFESTGGSCTGQPMVTLHYEASVTALDDMVTSGWVNSSDTVVTAPTNQAGTGDLQSNPTVTKLILAMDLTTPPGPSGDMKYFYYMDDTAATWCLYRPGGADANVDGYLDYVGINEPLCKEVGTITPLATTIYAESGTMQLIDGIWKRQCETDGTDFIEQIVVAAGTFKSQQYNYTSTDSTCSGTETMVTIAEGTVTAGDNFTTLGWHDGTFPGANAPIAKDGSGQLSATPTVTKLIIDIPAGVFAGTYYNFFYIDDTASTWWMYTDGPNEFPTVEYNEYLYNFSPYYKVN